MFLSFVALVFGFDFDEGQATEMMQQLGIVIGWAWNLYGSIVAQHRLTRDKGA